ncbi:MAG: hypothetical protein GF353_15820 [Candidatus Lokiarchaeota archaeon]|nr:hypothetical protein [Candidatus Lokiarchaeota archaeon]
MNVLVVGLTEKKAGKTSLARALIRFLKERNIKVCGYKPRSGGNLWYHWDIVKEGLLKGTLYGKDAKALFFESDKEVSITTINPVHRIWVPIDDGLKWSELPNFLMDRIMIEEKQIILYNKKIHNPLDDEIFNKLFSNSTIKYISNRSDLESCLPLYKEAEEKAYKELKQKFEYLICESYANIALPWEQNRDLDYVFAIKPFKIKIYDGNRYLKASKIVSSLPLEETTEIYSETLKPIKEISVPPFETNIIVNLKNQIKPIVNQILLDK